MIRNPLFFLAIVAILSTLASTTDHELQENALGRSRRPTKPEDLVPSDHGVESNTDFTNMMQYGLIEGLFKMKMGGTPDCAVEGMTLLRALYRFGAELVRTKDYSSSELQTAVEMIMILMNKCNYASTVQGIVVTQMVSYQLYQ